MPAGVSTISSPVAGMGSPFPKASPSKMTRSLAWESEPEEPEIEYDLSGDWIVDSDSIEIVDVEASDTSWICCICKSEFADGYGNNPHPVKEDIKGNKINYMLYSSTERCCDLCNTNYVIPARIKQAAETNKLEGGLW